MTYLAVIVSLGLMATGCARPTNESADSIVVAEVIDGDTIEIVVGSTTERVRLLGIDAPESVHPTVPVQCFGQDAATALRQLLPTGTEVDVFHDEQLRDHFDRLLLYVYRRADGLDVNLHLVEQGLAAATFYEPNVHFRSEIAGAEREAKAARRGLWGVCDGPDQPLQ